MTRPGDAYSSDPGSPLKSRNHRSSRGRSDHPAETPESQMELGADIGLRQREQPFGGQWWDPENNNPMKLAFSGGIKWLVGKDVKTVIVLASFMSP